MNSKIKIIFSSKSTDKKDIFENFLNIFGHEFETTVFEKSEPSTKVLIGEEELVRGASTKSLLAFESGEYDWGVSMEGGFCEVSGSLYMMCVVNIRTNGGSYLGLSSKVRLPQEIEDAVKRGVWIGDVLDKYQSKHESEEYTNELCQLLRTRRELFTQSLSNALLFLRHTEEISK